MVSLTNDNYYDVKDYMSVSEYKDFFGSLGIKACERTAYLRMNGQIEEKKSMPLLVGGYVDAYFEGTLDNFKEKHKDDIYTKNSLKAFEKKGNPDDLCLYADFEKANYIIDRIERDPMFMYYMSGEKQVIMTGEIEGQPWKIKVDSLLPDTIVDLKVMSEISKNKWIEDVGEFLNFIFVWGYDIQGAVYQEIVRQNIGKKLPFVIAVATKEDEPDIELIEVDQVYLDEALARVKADIPRYTGLKAGVIEPTQCHVCPCCRRDKVLMGTIMLSQIMNQK